MVKIKTRLHAKNASFEKWTKINESLIGVLNEVETFCGYCLLAKSKVPKSVGDARIHKCKYCEPDAQRLCEKYITANDQLIPLKLGEVINDVQSLMNKIAALPDVLKEE